jgi:hypothetical protein
MGGRSRFLLSPFLYVADFNKPRGFFLLMAVAAAAHVLIFTL